MTWETDAVSNALFKMLVESYPAETAAQLRESVLLDVAESTFFCLFETFL